VPEHLVVPFDAVKGFMDPAVQFGLQFEVQSPIRPREVDTAVVTPATSEAKPADIPAAGEAPKVVSLDQFRKK
jgi:hypothetical protein